MLALVFLSCSSRPSDIHQGSSKDVAKNVSENDDWNAITFFLTDTSIFRNPFVKLTTVDKEETCNIEWGNENANWSDNLMTLTDSQGYRMPPQVLWHNEKWICLMTNHSGPYSQHLFLPLNPETKPIFFAEDIEYTDSIHSFVCYINPNSDYINKSVTWTIQSLITNKSESFQLKIDEHSIGYPWYHNIYRKKDYLIIEYSKNEIKKINIKNYCN